MIKMRKIKQLTNDIKKNRKGALYRSAQSVRDHLITEWLKGNGGDGLMFEKGTDDYLGYKAASKRNRLIDLNFSGQLHKSLQAFNLGKGKAGVGLFSQRADGKDNNEIANRLLKKRDNIFKLNKKARKESVRQYEIIFK